MNHIARISVLTLLILSAATGNAENVTVVQDFDKMYRTDKTLTTDKDYLVGTTDFVTYTCSGTGARFFLDLVYNSKISINLPNRGSTVTTTQIEDLHGFQLHCYTTKNNPPDLKIYLSKDGVDFGEPLTADHISVRGTSVDVSFPLEDYYIRIVNADGSPQVSINAIEYYMDHCPKCFTYR
ncbi:MAG: hypothetical protein IJ249_05930 [Paludibacteraceae bacterium]|nr:hypothetical protein [Paludibacteraceae bacterium]